ncbi:hypothetical protein [Nocardioides maradonensis]
MRASRRVTSRGEVPRPRKRWRARSPHRRPAHQKTQSNIMLPGTPARIAAHSGRSPNRLCAPTVTSAALDPPRTSSSSGCDPISAGVSGHSASV